MTILWDFMFSSLAREKHCIAAVLSGCAVCGVTSLIVVPRLLRVTADGWCGTVVALQSVSRIHLRSARLRHSCGTGRRRSRSLTRPRAAAGHLCAADSHSDPAPCPPHQLSILPSIPSSGLPAVGFCTRGCLYWRIRRFVISSRNTCSAPRRAVFSLPRVPCGSGQRESRLVSPPQATVLPTAFGGGKEG